MRREASQQDVGRDVTEYEHALSPRTERRRRCPAAHQAKLGDLGEDRRRVLVRARGEAVADRQRRPPAAARAVRWVRSARGDCGAAGRAVALAALTRDCTQPKQR